MTTEILYLKSKLIISKPSFKLRVVLIHLDLNVIHLLLKLNLHLFKVLEYTAFFGFGKIPDHLRRNRNLRDHLLFLLFSLDDFGDHNIELLNLLLEAFGFLLVNLVVLPFWASNYSSLEGDELVLDRRQVQDFSDAWCLL